eukprot:5187753-Pyramimonas_sp.AAC.1
MERLHITDCASKLRLRQWHWMWKLANAREQEGHDRHPNDGGQTTTWSVVRDGGWRGRSPDGSA